MSEPRPPFRVPDLGAPTGGGQVSPVLVGRGELLALADRRLAGAADGRGELLFFAGEAGIGKSRLLREVAVRAAAAGFAVIGPAHPPATRRPPQDCSASCRWSCGGTRTPNRSAPGSPRGCGRPPTATATGSDVCSWRT